MASDTAIAPRTEPGAVDRHPDSFRSQLDAMGEQFRAALPAHIPPERFARVVMTAVQNNPDLLGKCDRRSLWNAAMKAAQDGLLPDGREGAIVIYGTAAQWMPMIGGIRKKVRNSGEIATWDVYVVHEKDEFAYELGDEPFIKHRPFLAGDPGKVIAAYSVATLKSGEKSREVMPVAAIEKVRAVSRAKNNGPWVAWFEEMCRKTVARRHAKLLPMSTDLDDLLRRDDDLYNFKESREEGKAAARPKSLASKLDMLGAPVPEVIDHQTGEITDEPKGAVAETVTRPKPAAKKAAAPRTAPPAEKESEASQPPLDQASGTATVDEDIHPDEGSSSAVPLSDEEKDAMLRFHQALTGCTTAKKLGDASGQFLGSVEVNTDEGSVLYDIVESIYGWHLDRISSKRDVAEIDGLVREALS